MGRWRTWTVVVAAVAVDLHHKETQIRYDTAGVPENLTAMIAEFEREGFVAEEVRLEGSWTIMRNQE